MTLAERVSEYVRACFTGLWIESHEHQDALAEIAAVCREQGWSLAAWDLATGLWNPGQPGVQSRSETNSGSDPLAALRSLSGMTTKDGTAILVLPNFHRFLGSPEIVQALVRQITAGKQNRTFVVILAPVVAIPVELEKLFVVVPHELPGRDQLQEIARGIGTEPGEMPDGPELETLLDAAS
ncbi:MAG: hypothetical protein IT428_29185 [Planctomycetaceae bacterium]|nr:hypothetical protein [Planctomycetaceae bacterium]